MAEARSIQQHIFLLPPGQVREALGRGGAPESKEAVAVDTREPNEGLFQFLAAHAFDRIAPEAVYCSHDTHLQTPSALCSRDLISHRMRCAHAKPVETVRTSQGHYPFWSCGIPRSPISLRSWPPSIAGEKCIPFDRAQRRYTLADHPAHAGSGHS